MNKHFRYIVFYTVFFCALSTSFAQLKIGYIQSERIRTEYVDFTDADHPSSIGDANKPLIKNLKS